MFELLKPQLDAIENLKTLVISAPCPKIFHSGLPNRLRTDASSVRLGTFLEQNYGTVVNKKWYPTGYSTRALEKETLSIVFAFKRFHEYLYGRRFTIINDNKPLKVIFNRSIFSCPYRIQIIFLHLQKYDF